jgi:hypothetical protein
VVLRLGHQLHPRVPTEAFKVVAHGEQQQVLIITQPPDPDVCWVVTLGDGVAFLQRVEPASYAPMEGYLTETVSLRAEAPPRPDPLEKRLTDAARGLASATHAASTCLELVAPDVPQETQRLLALVPSTMDRVAQDRVLGAIRQGVDAYGTFTTLLTEAEALLSETVTPSPPVEAPAAVSPLRALRHARQQAQAPPPEASTARRALVAAVSDARCYADGFRQAADLLVQAGLAVGAQLQVRAVAQELTALRLRLAHTRDSALQLPADLLSLVRQHAQRTGTAFPVPTLYWNEPKNVFAPPVVTEGP